MSTASVAAERVRLLGQDEEVETTSGRDPEALREQAADAVARVAEAGLLRGTTVREFGSPHGGTWLPLLADRGFRETDSATDGADVVLDSFGIMHEPDQRAAFAARAAAVAPGGVLLLQYQPLGGIVDQLQWTALRHGHFGYYTLTALMRLLAAAGLPIGDQDSISGVPVEELRARPAAALAGLRPGLHRSSDRGDRPGLRRGGGPWTRRRYW